MRSNFKSFVFTVPANTPEATPYKQTLEVVVAQSSKQMRVVIPNNQKGYGRYRIESREGALVPGVGSNYPWIFGDGLQLDVNLIVEKNETEVLTFVGWNSDPVDEHSLIVYYQ